MTNSLSENRSGGVPVRDAPRYSEDRPRKTPARKHVRALLLLMVLVNLAWSLYQLPLNRVIERRLCKEYFLEKDPSLIDRDGNIPEKLCKMDEIQQGLGRTQGVMETMWIVGDFIMTIPLVSLVERYGRRPILWLNLVPRIVVLGWTFVVGFFEEALPASAIMASPLFSVLGGDCVFNSVVYAFVAGLTDDYVLRATYFSQMNAISSIFAYQLGPALASATMSFLLWLPLWIGILLLLLAIPVIGVLSSGLQDEAIDDTEDAEQRAPLLSSTQLKAQDESATVVNSIKARLRTIKQILTTHPLNFGLLLVCFFLTSLASSDTKMFTQYISKRYNWNFASVGYLLSGKAVFNFFYLSFFIPTVLRIRARNRETSELSGGSGTAADVATMSYAKICFVFSIAGALAIALASTFWLLVPSLLLYALGIALPIFTYSLLKSPAICPRAAAGIDSTAHAVGSETQIFSIVMLVKTMGLLVGTPLMATLWVRGIGLGGAALGLPFFVSAATYLVAMGVFSFIRIDDGQV